MRTILLPLLLCLSVAACLTPRLAWAAEKEEVFTSAYRRESLARAYLRFQQELMQYPQRDSLYYWVHRRFDAVADAYMTGGYPKAARLLNELALYLSQQDLGTFADQTVLSLVIQPEHRIGSLAELRKHRQVEFQVFSLYEVPQEEQTVGGSLQAKFYSPSGQVIGSRKIPLDSKERLEFTLRFALPTKAVQAGNYVLKIIADEAVNEFEWPVLSRSVGEIAAGHQQLLQQAAEDFPKLADAIEVAKARNQLLVDRSNKGIIRLVVADLPELVGEIESECQALAAGKNPYRTKTGEYWRVFNSGDVSIPARVYVPKNVQLSQQTLPLLVAFHGAAGDENVFLHGYGAGQLKELAEKHQMIVVSPLTYSFLDKIEHFDVLMESVQANYSVDPQRVYLLGHSLGAMTVANISTKRASELAAVVCFAGAVPLSESAQLPKMLFYASPNDPVVPFPWIQLCISEALNANPALTLRKCGKFGHTIMVDALLPEAIDWLVEQRREQ